MNDGLSHALDVAVSGARARWPGLAVPEAIFRSWLTERGHVALASAEDIYLACGVSLGVPGAADALLESHRVLLDQLAKRAQRAGVSAEDFLQELSLRLLLPRGERPPRIADYRATGPLGAWLRVSGARLLLQLLERRRPNRDDVPLETALADAVVWESEDPQLTVVRREATTHLAAALREALAVIDAPTRALLRQHYVHRSSVDAMAVLLGVHRATAARRVAKARADLTSEVRRALTRKVNLIGADLDSLLRVARSSLGVSLARLLDATD